MDYRATKDGSQLFFGCFFMRSPMQRKFAAKVAHGARGE